MDQTRGLDNMQLTPSVVTDLFRDSLVGDSNKKPNETTDDYKFLGSNLKKIVLLVNSSDSFYLPDEDLFFITKMLEACKLNLADVAIVNHASSAVHISRLVQQLHPRIILLFGLEPTAVQVPFAIPAFKPQEYNNCIYLYTPSADKLNQNTEEGKLLKSKLWVCLRKLFEV